METGQQVRKHVRKTEPLLKRQAIYGLRCSAGLEMPIHAYCFGGQFWPVN